MQCIEREGMTNLLETWGVTFYPQHLLIIPRTGTGTNPSIIPRGSICKMPPSRAMAAQRLPWTSSWMPSGQPLPVVISINWLRAPV
jgi:hypothetical protein